MAGMKRKQQICRLPFDIVEDILTRIPVKDLVRFRCVCRRWGLLFHNEKFIKKHMTYGPRKFLLVSNTENWPCSIIYQHDSNGKPKMTCEELDLIGGDKDLLHMDVIGHYNGLFCLRLYEKTLAVWNPSLSELRKIPTSKPLCDLYMVGFGYDHSTDDYKIIVLSARNTQRMLSEDTPRAEISMLKSKSRMIDFPSKQYPIWHSRIERGTLLGKNIFWLAYEAPDTMVQLILCFDMVSETFEDSPCPPRDRAFRHLVVLRGRLCIVDNYLLEEDTKMVVWSPVESENTSGFKSWNKLATVTIANLGIPRERFIFDVLLSSSAEHAELLIRVIVKCKSEGGVQLFAYNIKEDTFRKVETHLILCGKFGDPCEYMESLVSTSRF